MIRAVVALAATLAATPAFADESGRIRVIGRAEAQRAPDFASVEIGVVARGPTPANALDATRKAAAGIVGAARALGAGEGDIATAAVTLEPAFEDARQPDGSVRQKPSGFTASNRVTIRLADLPKLGELMRRVLDGGANRIEGLSFGLLDPAGAEHAVQAEAMRDARARAERLAEAAGVRLGPAVAVTSPPRGDTPSPYPMQARAPAPAPYAKAVPLAAGSITVSAEVDAAFAIER